MLSPTGRTLMANATNSEAEDYVAVHYALARQHMASRASGSLILAIAEYTKVMAADPNYKDSCERLGYALEEEKGILQYISEFEEFLAANPDDVPTRYRLADYLRTMGRNEEAIHHWRVAAKLEYPDWSKSARKMLRKHYQITEE